MATKNDTGDFSEFEKQAMRDRAKELKAEAKAQKNRAEGEKILLAALKEMPAGEREIGEKLHEIAKEIAPDLFPKTWYGMPSYANKDGKVVFFYQPATKFEARYGTIGFTDLSNVDDSDFFPNGFGVVKMTPEVEKTLREWIKKAVS